MSIEGNKEVVRRYYEEVFNKGELDALDELAVAEYEEHDPLPGQETGRDGLRNRVSMLIAAFAPQFTIEDLIAEGDRVVARWTNSGVHRADFMGIPPTERTVNVTGIDVHRLQDGKMVEHWHVVDMLSMLVQLGVVTLPGAPGE